MLAKNDKQIASRSFALTRPSVRKHENLTGGVAAKSRQFTARNRFLLLKEYNELNLKNSLTLWKKYMILLLQIFDKIYLLLEWLQN